jgi:Peptidase C13 family
MVFFRSLVVATTFALAGLPAAAAAQDTHLAVIVGLAGDPEFAELYGKWAATLVDAAAGPFGVPRSQIQYLSEKPEADPKRTTGKSTRDEIAKAFGKLAAAKPDDVVFVVLMGHGTFDGRAAKFNLPGPDLTAADFEPLLKRLASRRVVIVNTASASGPFIEALSGPGRTIVTATRNGRESFATIFGGYFVDALTSDTADADKNKRVSVLEAFDFARREVAAAYERQGIILTEHALLDDSGDKEGTAQPTADGKEGRVAALLSLGTPGQESLPSDPALRTLHEERRALERRVESLRLMKDSMDAQKYAAELEQLVTELALKSRQIREAEGKKPGDGKPGEIKPREIKPGEIKPGEIKR